LQAVFSPSGGQQERQSSQTLHHHSALSQKMAQ